MFVSLVNDQVEKGDTLEDSIDKTIRYCIENSIMHMYLQKGSAEVKRMLITEWNDDEYREVIREEGREEGLEQGYSQAKQDMARKMKDEGAEMTLITNVTGMSEAEIAEL